MKEESFFFEVVEPNDDDVSDENVSWEIPFGGNKFVLYFLEQFGVGQRLSEENSGFV